MTDSETPEMDEIKLDPQLQAKLSEMWNSGDSQQIAVADCLLMIADNGDDSATLDFMQCCAEEMLAAAQAVIEFIQKRRAEIAAADTSV